MLILHETYDHWSVAVLTVTVHSSFFPTFGFFKKYVAFCTGCHLLTPIFSLPCIIMDLPIFAYVVIQECAIILGTFSGLLPDFWAIPGFLGIISLAIPGFLGIIFFGKI